MRARIDPRTLKLTASWQEGSKKREVRERIAEVKRARVLEDVWDSVKAAHAVGDWRVVLKWEGRVEELLEHLAEDADCDFASWHFCMRSRSDCRNAAWSSWARWSASGTRARRCAIAGPCW